MICGMELVERLPTVDEFVELLRRVGWPLPPGDVCERALGRSLAAICAAPDVVPFYQRLGFSTLESDLMRKAL